MSTFRLTIHTDNAAFAPDPSHELARILTEIADTLTDGGGAEHFDSARTLRDINGNAVGEAVLR